MIALVRGVMAPRTASTSTFRSSPTSTKTGVAPTARQHLAFQLECDDWRGRREVQLLIRHSWDADGGLSMLIGEER